MITKANELHAEAHKKCFIANSCNFPIIIKPNSVIATI
jgi:organic hydroperoxide reductase OsmC/OhrA